MLSLKNWVTAPGSRKGEKVVYARLSDGSLRRIKDPDLIRSVLLREAAYYQGEKRWWVRVWYWLLALAGR